MKIVQTPVRFVPFVGGVENLVFSLSKKLVKDGNHVTVVCANEPKSKPTEVIDGINVKRLSYIGKIANTNITPSLPLELIRTDFDVIHTHIPTPWSADWSMVASVLKRKPLWVTYHNDLVGKGLAGVLAGIYNQTFLKLVLGRAEKIIVTQESNKNWPALIPYRRKIVVEAPLVDTDRFHPLNDGWNGKNTVAFLSVLDEFHRYKGLDILLKAIALVKKEVPSVKLIVGGKGKLLPEYRQMARDLGIKKNVEFLGFIPDDKLVEFYNHCNVFVLPSTDAKQEGYGIVAAEALACGTPVIVTDIVGIGKEKNRKIFVVEPLKISPLEKKILGLLYE